MLPGFGYPRTVQTPGAVDGARDLPRLLDRHQPTVAKGEEHWGQTAQY
jgi:hypothetical protein